MTRYLVTSALPYVNGVKHLGNLVGSMLPADVYARFMRMEGEEVLFICATDEHGTPAEVSALEAGMDVREYCDMMHQIQKDIYRRFGLSFDYFGRSSSKENRNVLEVRVYLGERRSMRWVFGSPGSRGPAKSPFRDIRQYQPRDPPD
jgi:methionyl-tRNA synthetase